MNPSDSSASPVAPISRRTRTPSASVGASGFSQSTGLPARTAATTCSACTESCDAITTASTDRVADQRVARRRRPGRPAVSADAAASRAGEIDVRDSGDLGAPHGAAQRVRVVGAHDPGADHADAQYRRCLGGHRASDERRRSVWAASSATKVSWSQSFCRARHMSCAWLSGFSEPTGVSRSRFVGKG